MTRYYFREWREAAGWSQRQMAKLTGLSKTTISRIESGKRAWTSDFLEDFQQAVRCFHIWEPLDRPPYVTNGGPPRRADDAMLQARIFQRAREIRKSLRSESDSGKSAKPQPRKKRKTP